MGATHPETREKLIRAATDLIFKRGYGHVGIQELCEYAKVKKGSFYHFFPSKRELALAALEQHWKTYRLGIAACVSAQMPAFERMELLFNSLHRQYLAAAASDQLLTGCPFGTLSMEVSAYDTVLREALERIFEDWAGLFAQFFQDAINAAELPPQTDARRAGQALLAYLEGVLLLVKTMQSPNLLEQLKPTRAQFESFGRP